MQSGLKNSYAQDLPELSKKCIPSGFQNSEIILKNYELGEELGFSKKFLDSDKCLNVFSGNALLRDSIPIAQAYSLDINLDNLIQILVMEERSCLERLTI